MNPYSSIPWYKAIAVFAIGLAPATLAFYTYGKQPKKNLKAAAKSSLVLGVSGVAAVIANVMILQKEIQAAAQATTTVQNTTPGLLSGIGAPMFQTPKVALGWEPSKLGLITATKSAMAGVYGCNGCY